MRLWRSCVVVLSLAAALGCSEGIRRADTRLNLANTYTGPPNGAARPLPAIAAGPDQIVGIVGDRVRVKQRGGGAITNYCLSQFTGCGGGSSTEHEIWYDMYSERWFLMNVRTANRIATTAARDVSANSSPEPGAFCVAVSDSSTFSAPVGGEHTATSGEPEGTCPDCGEDGCNGNVNEDAHWKAYTFFIGYAKFNGGGGGGGTPYPTYPEDARMAVNVNKIVLTGVLKNGNANIGTNTVCTAAGTPYACCSGANAGNCGDIFNREADADRSVILAVDKQAMIDRRNVTATDFINDNSICTATDTPYTCCTGNGLGKCQRIPGYTYFATPDRSVSTPHEWVMVPSQVDGVYEYANPILYDVPEWYGQLWLLGLDDLQTTGTYERRMLLRGLPPESVIALDTTPALESGVAAVRPPTGVPQKGTTSPHQLIGTWRPRIADFKYNRLAMVAVWTTKCAHHDSDNQDRDRTCIQYETFTDNGDALEYFDSGKLKTTGRYYYTPAASIAYGGNDILIVANGSGNPDVLSHSLDEYVSVWSAGRHMSDDAGVLSNLTMMVGPTETVPGAPYDTDCNTGGCGIEPWGRYSSISVDPTTDVDNELAGSSHVDLFVGTEVPRYENGGSTIDEWTTKVRKLGNGG